MRREVEITGEDFADVNAGEPTLGPDGQAPEFGGHVTPRAPETDGAQAASSTTGDGAKPNHAAGADSGMSAYVVALQADLDDARGKVEDLEKRLLYAQAEFQNFKRRKEEQDKDLQKYVNSELLKTLLPVVDNFERALAAAEQTKNFDALIGGVSGTLKQLQAFLQKAGATPIDALGKEFDPAFHEAIGHSEAGDYPANTVAEEVQRGYMMHDRVLRPALVKVAQG